jgi:hypothetical protein
VRIKSDDEAHKKAFESIAALARLIERERTPG